MFSGEFMILSNVIFKNSLEKFLHLERYVNRGSPSGFTFKNTTSIYTSPLSNNSRFYLYGINLGPEIARNVYGVHSSVLSEWDIIVHPDMLYEEALSPFIIKNREYLRVSPTASGRTVRVLEKYEIFLKLHYQRLLGRIKRVLEKKHAISALEISSFISRKIDEKELPSNFFFMREISAKVVQLPFKDSNQEWGVIVREALPYPYNSKIKFTIPCFSLFSKDLKSPDDPSLLIQLIKKQDKKVENFLFEDLIAPIMSCYFSIIVRCGLQMDAQAQNTLIGIDENFKIVGIISRDAGSIDKDITLIEQLSIDAPFKPNEYKCICKGMYNYQILHSFFFDFKLGEYLITPIIEEAMLNFKFDEIKLRKRIKDFNSQFIEKLPKDFFPEHWYNYANIVFDRSKPRPYIKQKNPKYR